MKKITIENIKKIISTVDKNINILEEKAKKLNLYINISSSQEQEKALNREYKFMNLSTFSMCNYRSENGLHNLTEDFKRAYENRYSRVLSEVGFISLNDKTNIIKCSSSYGHLNMYYLQYIEEFENINLNDGAFEICTKFQNGNIEFKFKNPEHFEIFKKVTLFTNLQTKAILKNITKEEIKTFLEAVKTPHLNEHYIINEVSQRLHGKNFRSHNMLLIKKELIKRGV